MTKIETRLQKHVRFLMKSVAHRKISARCVLFVDGMSKTMPAWNALASISGSMMDYTENELTDAETILNDCGEEAHILVADTSCEHPLLNHPESQKVFVSSDFFESKKVNNGIRIAKSGSIEEYFSFLEKNYPLPIGLGSRLLNKFALEPVNSVSDHWMIMLGRVPVGCVTVFQIEDYFYVCNLCIVENKRGLGYATVVPSLLRGVYAGEIVVDPVLRDDNDNFWPQAGYEVEGYRRVCSISEYRLARDVQ